MSGPTTTKTQRVYLFTFASCSIWHNPDKVDIFSKKYFDKSFFNLVASIFNPDPSLEIQDSSAKA